MSIDFDQYLELPEDPELRLVAYERLARQNLDESIRVINRNTDERYVLYETRERQAYYATKLMAFHDAHGFQMLTQPNLWRNSDRFENDFSTFLDEVTYWMPQIEVRHATGFDQLPQFFS